MKYEPLPDIDKIEDDSVDLEKFKIEAMSYLDEAKEKRRKDKYNHLFIHVKSRLKSLNKKIVLLEKSNEENENLDSYKEMGDLCYIIESDPSLLEEYLNEGLLKNYDKELSAKENGQLYYKKYKKSKSALEHNIEEIKKAHDEIDYYNRILFQLNNANDEDLEELAILLSPSKGHKENKGKKSKIKISPYYIKYHDTRIGFGKTDEQNNILTFEKSSPNYEYFHIANYSGSHVVILKDNPTDEDRLVASELALILSKKEDGDIFTTKIKNVKKGDSLGKVNLRNHTIIHLNKVREETKELIYTAKKL